jgi:ubiquinone/menaquinone biosynthesis C-methylase UbiE
MTTDRSTHWNRVYRSKADAELSWHQDEPSPSLELIQRHAAPGSRILDVGGGASPLAGRLVSAGYPATVLDVSDAAIQRSRERLGSTADAVSWVVGDVTLLPEIETVDLWHDRAVFHFLTDPADQQRYVQLASRAVAAAGLLVLGAFALDGPERCSGLAVQRYDSATMAAAFLPRFTLVESLAHTHRTPWGSAQSFIYAVLRAGPADPR